MERPITGFRTDEHGDWCAILSCGHPQHVRHNPPFTNRPWTTTEEGRNSKLGALLNCVRCDRFELPADFVAYRQTPVFTEQSIPAAFTKDHTTKAGVWAKIVVIEGTLRYRAEVLDTEVELSTARPGIVLPEVRHCVEPVGTVRFFVEFYRSPIEE